MNQLTEVTQLKAWKNWGIVAIALGSLLLLTVIAAPQNPRLSGSTYSHAPSGYGAWYEFMEQQGVSMQRWEQPFSELPDATTETSSGASSGTGGMTLLRTGFPRTQPRPAALGRTGQSANYVGRSSTRNRSRLHHCSAE
jgi:hypothetical protein